MLPNILDASAPPEGDLVKDVHAYFGLCMYFAQVFETGLINLLTVLETSSKKYKSQQEYAEGFDSHYADNEKLTFGNLLKALAKQNILPTDVMRDAKSLKDKRDHLAHRFFRDHSLDELTVGGCQVMIEALEESRARFMELDDRITVLLEEVLRKRGVDPLWFKKESNRIQEEMRKEAVARRGSKIKLP